MTVIRQLTKSIDFRKIMSVTAISGSRMGENQDPDPGSAAGMNIPDHISGSLETIFWDKILQFFDADADPDPDPGFGNLFDPGSGMEKFVSGINISDPQY
jgi:hypothetical protein